MPLYKFTLDEETGNITVREIMEYHVKKNEFTHRKTYVHKEKYGTVYTREESFDQLKHNTVYSFNPDPTHAKDIIIEAIGQKLAKAQKEVERLSKVFKEVHT